MIRQGIPITVVSQVLGHASAKMTLDVYGSHLLPDSLDRAADAMERAITSALGRVANDR